jgi:hypothetical protein
MGVTVIGEADQYIYFNLQGKTDSKGRFAGKMPNDGKALIGWRRDDFTSQRRRLFSQSAESFEELAVITRSRDADFRQVSRSETNHRLRLRCVGCGGADPEAPAIRRARHTRAKVSAILLSTSHLIGERSWWRRRESTSRSISITYCNN